MIGIAVISGFTETERDQCGLDEIQRDLDAKYKLYPNVEVYDLRSWKADMRGLAALMDRDGITEVIIISYSHGAGYASPRLARELDKRGIVVAAALLCDPVYRPLWLPRWTIAQVFAVRALIPESAVIKFPLNVETIEGVRQTRSIPRGHKVRIGHLQPKHVRLVIRPDVNHSNIDSSSEFRTLVHQVLKQLIN